MPCIKNYYSHSIPSSSVLLSSVLKKQSVSVPQCILLSSPVIPGKAQRCPGDNALHLYGSSHQTKITAVLILSLSNSGSSLCKLKSLLSDNVSKETQFILIHSISCHSELTVRTGLRYAMLALQL